MRPNRIELIFPQESTREIQSVDIFMALSEEISGSKRLATGSHQTALCVIPRPHFCQDVNRLRALYDNAYGKWPAHINIIYPFVSVESLPQAIELIRSKLADLSPDSGYGDIHLQLEKSDHFSHRHDDTIYIAPTAIGSGGLKSLRNAILESFQLDNEIYRPHLTIGQSRADDTSSRDFLLAKASLLLPIDWHVKELVFLVRERTNELGNASSQMKIWGSIGLADETASEIAKSPKMYAKPQTEEQWSDEEEKRIVSRNSGETYPLLQSLQIKTNDPVAEKISPTQLGTTYHFAKADAIWEPVQSSGPPQSSEQMPNELTISSYNVLVDSFLPPVRDRYDLLTENILAESALADILILQEISDDFLSHLLGHDTVRSHYPFTTHGPPNQPGIGPLASLRNIVVLSRWKISWEWVPFERRHKGAVVLTLETIGKSKDSAFLPLVVAGVHLTCGLTDGSVAAKTSQLQTLIGHLSRKHPANPWIVAGDFNITTSAFTIDAALKKKSISSHTASTLFSLGTMLSEARLSDSWYVARAETGDTSRPTQRQMDVEDLYEGEQGATFDPTTNPLAAESAGRGSNNRPQRYDRILVKGEDFLRVSGFNMFGLAGENEEDVAEPYCGSDHWGVRSTLRIDTSSGIEEPNSIILQLAPVQLKKAPPSLSDMAALKACLADQSMFPTEEQTEKRKEVFALLKNILQQNKFQRSDDTADNNRFNIPMVVVPVGSYGLGVWDTSSDIDILCIGSISAKTFFALISQRLRRVADLGVRILRKVKAKSGTMLELDVRGIKLDLQYCPATRIAERCVQFSNPLPLWCRHILQPSSINTDFHETDGPKRRNCPHQIHHLTCPCLL